jgi:hypothetical protein
MKFMQEVTEWPDNTPNHVYYLNDDKSKMFGYAKSGTTVIEMFSKPIKFDSRRRKFKEVAGFVAPRVEPVEEVIATRTWEVIGSKGDKYLVSLVDGALRCTCSGFKWKGKCKHIEGVKA